MPSAKILWAMLVLLILSLPVKAFPADFTIYGIYRGLDFGNPGETPEKDFYVNMGAAEGLRVGESLEVFRKNATYDLVAQKLYKDMTFPIARLKLIHVENNAAVARLEKIYPPEKTPVISPRAVMVGDIVRPTK